MSKAMTNLAALRKLEGRPIVINIFDDLRHIRDLVEYDSPLVSEYGRFDGERFLLFWCDCDDDFHRWMLVRQDTVCIESFVQGKIPLDYLVKGCSDSFVTFFDCTRNPSQSMHIVEVPFHKIPDDYFPDDGLLYEDISDKFPSPDK
jgi:hypothetical protein